MSDAELDELRAKVSAAWFQLRSLRKIARDTLTAVASLQDHLAELGPELGLTLEGTAEGGTADDEYQDTAPRSRHRQALDSVVV